MEIRKQEEAEFHNKIRAKSLEESKDFQRFTSNRKFYSITRSSEGFKRDFLAKNCLGKNVLDYCCGDGPLSFFLAEHGACTYGIDISPVSIENCKKESITRGLEEKTHFFVMDAEDLKFTDNCFDLIVCSGVLHHLNIKKAYSELSRVLKFDGKIICTEPLVYNPTFQFYRKMTPHLRTKWETEHILRKKDINLAKNYFGRIETKFFYLLALLAVPFRNFPGFHSVLWVLEKLDSLILRLPFIKWWAWQIVFILSDPQK